MKKTRDREILALSLLVKTLRPLDLEARKRAIDYALKRLEEEDKETAGDLTREERWRRFGNTPPEDATLLSPRKTQAAMEREEFTAAQEREMKKAVGESTTLSPRKTPIGE